MFRKMRRIKQEVSKEECEKILNEERRGVLSMFGEDGYPYGVPINFKYEDGKIYFHGAKQGHKIDALKANDHVCFTVYNKGYLEEGKRGLNVTSVIVFGTVRFVEDVDEAYKRCKSLGLKYFPDEPDYIEDDAQRLKKVVQILELNIDHMTGKLVNES